MEYLDKQSYSNVTKTFMAKMVHDNSSVSINIKKSYCLVGFGLYWFQTLFLSGNR